MPSIIDILLDRIDRDESDERSDHAVLYRGITAILLELRDLRRELARKGMIEMRTIDEVLGEIRAQKSQIAGVKSLIQQLRQQVKDATSNLPPEVQAKIDTAFDEAHSASAELTDAINAAPDGGTAPVSDGSGDGGGTDTGTTTGTDTGTTDTGTTGEGDKSDGAA